MEGQLNLHKQILFVWDETHSLNGVRCAPEEVGHKKSNLEAGQRKLAGSFVMTHNS